MEHEYTISGRLFPQPEQLKNLSTFKQLMNKIGWAEEDFKETGFMVIPSPSNEGKAQFLFSMKSADLDCKKLENICMSLSLILGCTVMLCKDDELYGVANVFNGGSDYEVVDEDCFLWIYEQGKCLLKEKTKFWNPKFKEREQQFLNSETAERLSRTLLSLTP